MQGKITRIFLVFSAIFLSFEPGLALARNANDPHIQQWGYTATGVPLAWDYTTGSHDVIVAVIDNGIVASHADLQANMWRNEAEVPGNGRDDDQNGYVDDVNGWDFVNNDNDPAPDAQYLAPDQSDIGISHGTSVAGIIGAIGNNSRDGAGIAWEVRLMNLRAADNKGDGFNGDLAEAITYAVKNGASIINLSVNSQQDDETLRTALRFAVDRGVAVFASAGNLAASYTDLPSFPVCTDRGAAKQWVIGLSAVSEDRRLSSFSNYGPDCIDLTAPGENVNAAGWYGVDGYVSGWAGTSFATPFASGAAVLIKALRPDWKADDIYRAMLGRVSHTCMASDTAYQQYYGYGLLRVDRAVRAANAGPRKSSDVGIYPYMGSVGLWAGDARRVEDWLLPTTTARTTATSRGFFTMGTFAGTNAVAAFHQFPCTEYYAVAKAEGKKNQRITVYDKQWNATGSFVIASPNPVILAFEKSAGQDARLAVATAASRKTVVELYSVVGKKVGTWDLGAAHKGVTQLTSVPDTGNWSLAALVSQTNGVQLITARNGKTVATVTLPKAEYRLAAGDFDARGQGSIVVAPVGLNPTVKLYNMAAEWELGLPITAPSAQWDWTVGDYNDDARAEIIMYPTTSTAPARVLDYSGRVVEEISLFSELSSGRRWVLWP